MPSVSGRAFRPSAQIDSWWDGQGFLCPQVRAELNLGLRDGGFKAHNPQGWGNGFLCPRFRAGLRGWTEMLMRIVDQGFHALGVRLGFCGDNAWDMTVVQDFLGPRFRAGLFDGRVLVDAVPRLVSMPFGFGLSFPTVRAGFVLTGSRVCFYALGFALSFATSTTSFRPRCRPGLFPCPRFRAGLCGFGVNSMELSSCGTACGGFQLPSCGGR
jgi:hypothetical protein